VDVEVPLAVEELFGFVGVEGGGAVDGADDGFDFDEDDRRAGGGFGGGAVEVGGDGGAGEVAELDVVGEEVGVRVVSGGEFAVAWAFFSGDFPGSFEGGVELDDFRAGCGGDRDEGQRGCDGCGAEEGGEVFHEAPWGCSYGGIVGFWGFLRKNVLWRRRTYPSG